ncbi:hydrogenase expression/formation protein HypE [bacterium BMS3Abin03]|nr:hydrogenase expression/formation protein HypE [bacterium BMS3Abin03]HDZ58694.1 hydrogenase expression/formation protein HypE [Ignavibacteriales bacterium]
MNKKEEIKQIDFTGGLQCPIPKSDYDRVLLAHGGGGTLSHQLISKMFFPHFDNDLLNEQHDSAIFNIDKGRLAFTTDSYVVQPIFFSGGDIGELAVNGTVNDLTAAGAHPLYISAGFIIEEGFLIEELWQIVQSMKRAADNAGVMIVTGDTKVVDKGKGDKIFINTSGIGLIKDNINISPKRCIPGDKIIISGKIAEHGITIMSEREGLEFDSTMRSDTAPMNKLFGLIEKFGEDIHVMRDPTRGGIASTLNEIAETANVGILIDEEKIPISGQVDAACEILGLDPLYIANEGKMIFIVSPEIANEVLKLIRSHVLGKDAEIIGTVTNEDPGILIMKTSIGSNRVVDMISGEQLPRIC